MKKGLKCLNINYLLYALIPSAIISFLWLALGQIISSDGANESVRLKCTISNIGIYAFAVLIFLTTFIFMCFLGENKKGKNMSDKYFFPLGTIIYGISIIFIMLAILWEDKYVFVSQTKWSFRHNLWFPIYMLLLLFVSNIFAYKLIPNDNTKNKKFRVWLIIVLSGLVMFLTFSPNPFGDLGGELMHFDAYINSILNASKRIPYSYEVNSIYGHYGIFYIFPVKLFHFILPITKWQGISLTIALVGGVTYTMLISVLSRKIRKDSIFFLAAFAIGIWSLGFSRGNYYQGFPHRIFFQAITIFSLMKLLDKPFSKYRKVIVLLVASASIVWNFEVGIVCTIVICTCLFIIRFQNHINFLNNMILSILNLMISLIIAYLIVAIYNICSGGHLPSILEYIYPIASQDYHVIDLLQLRLDIPVSLYFLYFITLLGAFCICGFRIITRQSNNTIFLAFLCSLMGMGVFTYYMNRVCFSNMQIATPMVVIIWALTVDRCPSLNVIDNLKRIGNLRVIIGKIALFLLVILSMESIFNLGYIISFVRNSSYTCAPLQEFTDQIGDLPEGTDSIGLGASVFSTCISGSKIVYSMDWADMHPAGKEYWYNEVKQNNSIQYLVFEESLLDEVTEMFPNSWVANEFIYSDANKCLKWYLLELLDR